VSTGRRPPGPRSGRRSSLPGCLLRRIPRVVAERRWCGGLHRAELAAAVGYPSGDPVFTRALLACYRRRQVDFCGDYVVTPASAVSRRRT